MFGFYFIFLLFTFAAANTSCQTTPPLLSAPSTATRSISATTRSISAALCDFTARNMIDFYL
jgi:hypothetical protein